MNAKVTTTLTAPGERAVKVGGEYIGLITRETEGWMWTGNRRAYRTFTLAAQALAEHKSTPVTTEIDAPTAPQFAPGDHGIINGRGFTVSTSGANYAMVNWLDNGGRGIISDLTDAVRTMECTGFVLDIGRDWDTIKPLLGGAGETIATADASPFTYRVALHDGIYYGIENCGNGGSLVDHGTNLHAAKAWLKAAAARP